MSRMMPFILTEPSFFSKLLVITMLVKPFSRPRKVKPTRRLKVAVDFLMSFPGLSEELFVDLIFNGKSRVRVPSEMLISNQLNFQGQEISLRC
jgi:hypothetical protein